MTSLEHGVSYICFWDNHISPHGQWNCSCNSYCGALQCIHVQYKDQTKDQEASDQLAPSLECEFVVLVERQTQSWWQAN